MIEELAKITTTTDLVNALRTDTEIKEEDLCNLRYAIYVRKSTDDGEKQVRSIEDQEAECRKLAIDYGITVLESNIIREKHSAKESGIRPKFRALLDRIIDGELDGIIAWHPNRLSRNMGEAGEIIDLLDKHIIKDLKFASHTFVNDPSGKMLLGIVFVMAKQYSDQLSTDINRGNRKSVEAGAYINSSKHGYYKDNNKHLRPNGRNFALLKEAFEMRIAGETLNNIAYFLNSSGYTKKNKQGDPQKKHTFTIQNMSTIFSDPIYAGVNHYGKNVADLTELYDFLPMITVEEYVKINNFDPYKKTFKQKKAKKSKKEREADLLNGKVTCHYCKNNMTAGISKGKYYYFRCVTKGCERHNKGTRAKIIVDYVKEYLKKKPFSSPEAYQSYKDEILRLQKEETRTINTQINNANRNLGKLEADIQSIKANIAKEKDQELVPIQKEQLKITGDRARDMKKGIAELIEKKDNIIKSPLVFEEFIKVIDEIPQKLEKVQSSTQLDSILSKIFLNFSVTQKTVEKHRLNDPFRSLERLNNDEFIDCGDGGNRTRV